MSNLQIETIRRILPDALKNLDGEKIKEAEKEIARIFEEAKLKIFNPRFLEYFHDKPDLERFKSGYTYYDEFKKLGLSEERRIKDPRVLKENDIIYIIIIKYDYLGWNDEIDYGLNLIKGKYATVKYAYTKEEGDNFEFYIAGNTYYCVYPNFDNIIYCDETYIPGKLYIYK